MINDKDEWGNISLPGMSDEELLSPNLNIKLANRIKANDPVIKAKLSASMQQVLEDPEKVRIRNEAARRGGDTKANSEEYQKLMTEVNQKKALDPQFSKNISKGIQKKLKDPEYQKSRREGNDKKRNNPLYKAKMTEVNRKKAQSPNFSIKNSLGIKKKWEDPEYQAKQLAKALSQGTPVIGPDGKTYLTTKIASDATGLSVYCIRNYSKNNLHGWKKKENN